MLKNVGISATVRRWVLGGVAGTCGLLLSGCGTVITGPAEAPITPGGPTPYNGPTFTVKVMAGALPLVGSSVQFYSAGTTGNGSAGTALLSAAVLTDVTGVAAIPANYTCPSATGMTYLKASGGGFGASGTVQNANTVLMTAVGACSSVVAGSSFVVNEATTVGAVYSLQAFYAGGSIGASETNLTGLTNAFQTAGTLANATTGGTSGTALPANAVSPVARVNALADMLNACLVKASSCTALYGQAPSGSAANTLDAVYDLARYPGKNVAGIFAQSQLSTAYGASLPMAPTDWTLFVTYSGGGLSNPSSLGVDSTGSVWVANYFFSASKFSPIGVPEFADGITGAGLNNSYGLAIDQSDNAWITNEQPALGNGTIGSVTVLSPAGAPLAGNGFTAGGLNFPLSIAIDPNGTTWVVDYGNSRLTLLDKNGVPLSGPTGYTTDKFTFPIVVALDGNHNAWIGNQAKTSVTKVASDLSSAVNYDCCNNAAGIAIDSANNVWVANYYGDSVSLLSSTGAVLSNGGYTGNGSIDRPQGIAVDGAGNVFVANYRAGYLTELAGVPSGTPGLPLSSSTGLGADAGLLEAYSLALDASGNVWVANQGNDTITKFIGLAVPVKTPLSGVPKLP